MIKAVIIDDEQHCIDRLQMLISTYCKQEVTVIHYWNNVPDALLEIDKHKPDLIFLDIHVGAYTGFDFIKEFTRKNEYIIFTTAFEKYALQAFKLSATDYLLKPIDKDDLLDALEKITLKNKSEIRDDKMNALLYNYTNFSSQKKIAIPTTNGLSFIKVDDVVRCESDVNYTIIHLKDKKKLVVAKTLKDFEEIFTPLGFFRIHNSHLINLAYIKAYNRGKGGSVIMEDDSELEVSTRRKEEFLKLHKDF